MSNVYTVSFFGLPAGEYASFVGKERQMVINSDTCAAASIHDGTTVGGHAILFAESNLSELSSKSTARTNLGLGTASTKNTSAFLQATNNLQDLTDVSAARTNLGLGTSGTHDADYFLLAANNLSDVSNKETALTNLGCGAIAITNLGTGLYVDNGTSKNLCVTYGTTSTSACVGNDSRVIGALQSSNNLSDVADASAARAHIGVAIGTNVQAYSAALTALASGDGSALNSLSVTSAELPLATTVAKGAVYAADAVSNQYIYAIGSDGLAKFSQPSFTLGSTACPNGQTVSSVTGLTLTSSVFGGSLSNGTTATTQSTGDGSTKVATCAYADAAASSAAGSGTVYTSEDGDSPTSAEATIVATFQPTSGGSAAVLPVGTYRVQFSQCAYIVNGGLVTYSFGLFCDGSPVSGSLRKTTSGLYQTSVDFPFTLVMDAYVTFTAVSSHTDRKSVV